MVDLEDRSYYHGRISRDEAVDRLTRQGRDGSFLLRMSETQDGVYTISVMQGQAVRHIRVINVADGYILTPGDRPDLSVWALIANQRNRTLTNSFNSYDAVALRHPLASEETVIAPDLLSAAGEAGMEVNDFDSDVAAFLEGGVSVKELVRRRSQKAQSTRRPSGREANPCMLLCCLLLSVSDLV
eukprot:m.87503 g.87503  ORF g.87503 m.87503 type:complete len:185 (-) comp50979_c0_seq2:36-590(-)